jgi:hypothetical protein
MKRTKWIAAWLTAGALAFGAGCEGRKSEQQRPRDQQASPAREDQNGTAPRDEQARGASEEQQSGQQQQPEDAQGIGGSGEELPGPTRDPGETVDTADMEGQTRP